MEKFIVVVTILMAIIAIAQLARVYDLARTLKGGREEDISERDNKLNANLMIVFMVLFYAGFIWLMIKYGNGLPEAASKHGVDLDQLLNFNWVIVIGVFFLCNTLLFVFARKYYYREHRTALYFPHNNRLEMLWTVVPAVVLGIIIVYGLMTWQDITDDSTYADDHIKIELYAKQFDWTARYAVDGKLGDANYLLVNSENRYGVANGLGLIDSATVASKLKEYQETMWRNMKAVHANDSAEYFDVMVANCEDAIKAIDQRINSTIPVFTWHSHGHDDEHAEHGEGDTADGEDHHDDGHGEHAFHGDAAKAKVLTEIPERGDLDHFMEMWQHNLEGAEDYKAKLEASNETLAELEKELEHLKSHCMEYKNGIDMIFVYDDKTISDITMVEEATDTTEAVYDTLTWAYDMKVTARRYTEADRNNDLKPSFQMKITGTEAYDEAYENYRKYTRLVNRVYGIQARLFNDEYTSPANDIVTTGVFKLPVNREVVFYLRSQDIIHSAYMPHFRAQMNTVPGMVTQFRFTPTITTKEMRKKVDDEKFDYVLLCNKICGSNHFNMQMKIEVVSEEEYKEYIDGLTNFNNEVVGETMMGKNEEMGYFLPTSGQGSNDDLPSHREEAQ